MKKKKKKKKNQFHPIIFKFDTKSLMIYEKKNLSFHPFISDSHFQLKLLNRYKIIFTNKTGINEYYKTIYRSLIKHFRTGLSNMFSGG